MKHRHTPNRSVFAIVVAIAVLLVSNLPASAAKTGPSPYDLYTCGAIPGRGPQGRALVLIQGMFSRSLSEPMWTRLTSQLSDLYGGFVYFSYSGRPHDYEAEDTLQSISEHDVPLLRQLIESCRVQGWTSIDLIGHSKGGVVANEYVKVYGLTAGQADPVHHVVTLDAPINGSEMAWLLLRSPGTDLPAPWRGAGLAGGEGAAELARMFEQRNTVRFLNQQAALRRQQMGACVLTVTNDQDIAISMADAIIDGFGASYSLGANLRGDMGRMLGHHLTLDVPNESTELQDIRDCLSGRMPPDRFSLQALPGLRQSLRSFLNDAASQSVPLLLSDLLS